MQNKNTQEFKSPLTDVDELYDGFHKVKKSKPHKSSTLQWQKNTVDNIFRLSKEYEACTHKKHHCKPFLLNERGKLRRVQGSSVDDKVGGRVNCDKVICPSILPHLSYYNSASLKGRGTSQAREHIVEMLRSYYRTYHTNEGWILIWDISKYYDNIDHETAFNLMKKYVKDPIALTALEESFRASMPDVSWMSEEEFENFRHFKYNSLEHLYDKETGEKYMSKGCDIGDQESQMDGVLFLNPIDHYLEQHPAVFGTGRYMDDFLAVVHDKTAIPEILEHIEQMISDMYLFLNEKKTHVYPISKSFKYLNRHYFLTETGKVVERIDKKTWTRLRRKYNKVTKEIKQLHGCKKEQKKKYLYEMINSQVRSNWKCLNKYQKKESKKMLKRIQDL